MKEVTIVSDDDIHIMLSWKTLLCSNGKKTYAKRYGNEDFAVPIRCYEWAEVFELIAP